MSRVHTDAPRYGGPRLSDALHAGWDAVRRVLGSALHAVQRAQMMRALGGMSDSQLARMGLRRSDIPRYAEKLVAREGEGGNRRAPGA